MNHTDDVATVVTPQAAERIAVMSRTVGDHPRHGDGPNTTGPAPGMAAQRSVSTPVVTHLPSRSGDPVGFGAGVVVVVSAAAFYGVGLEESVEGGLVGGPFGAASGVTSTTVRSGLTSAC